MTSKAWATPSTRGVVSKCDETQASISNRKTRDQDARAIRVQSGLSIFAVLFLVSLFIPWLWPIGPVIISPFRLFLIFCIIPCLVAWLRGKAGGFLLSDFLILFYSFWCAVVGSGNSLLEAGKASGTSRSRLAHQGQTPCKHPGFKSRTQPARHKRVETAYSPKVPFGIRKEEAWTIEL